MNSNNPVQNTMAKPALIFGVLSVCSVLIFFISIPLGALGIIFALLSRTGRLLPRAKTGLILSIAGIILTISLTASSMITTIRSYGGWDNYVTAFEEYLGDYLEANGYDPSDFGISSDSDTGI